MFPKHPVSERVPRVPVAKGCFQGFPFPDAIVRHCRFAASARNSLQIVALVWQCWTLSKSPYAKASTPSCPWISYHIHVYFVTIRCADAVVGWFIVTFIPVKLTFVAIVRCIRLPQEDAEQRKRKIKQTIKFTLMGKNKTTRYRY